MSAPGEPHSRGGGDDLVGDLIAEVARTQGIAISRDDPVIAVVLLNQLVLRRYLEEALTPATAAIREATREAVAEIKQLAAAQATWLDDVSLKDRAAFLEKQKALHNAWKTDMESLIEGQNGALQQIVMQTVTRLRATPTLRSNAATSMPIILSPLGPRPLRHWCWLLAGTLFGMGTTLVATLANLGWTRIIGQ